ncbi:MAG: hypothetical protein WC501_02500 [Candidatus Micrarchaeia archaeon]
MKIEFSLSKEEWSETDKSDMWLYSKLENGEIPDSPKYIKKIYNKLVEIKKETKNTKFDYVEIQVPEQFKNNKDIRRCDQNFLSICAHVFENSDNRISGEGGEKLNFIMSFK